MHESRHRNIASKGLRNITTLHSRQHSQAMQVKNKRDLLVPGIGKTTFLQKGQNFVTSKPLITIGFKSKNTNFK